MLFGFIPCLVKHFAVCTIFITVECCRHSAHDNIFLSVICRSQMDVLSCVRRSVSAYLVTILSCGNRRGPVSIDFFPLSFMECFGHWDILCSLIIFQPLVEQCSSIVEVLYILTHTSSSYVHGLPQLTMQFSLT